MESSTKLRVFTTCSEASLHQPKNPTDDAILSSPTLNIIMEADKRFGEEVELCHNAMLSWYMTTDVTMDLVDTLDAFMLASALLTTAFKDSILIDDMLKTIRNVRTSSSAVDSPCKIVKSSTKMTIGNTTLDRKDLCTLYPIKWLNDQVVHAYLRLLKSDFNSVHHRGCYVLSCFLATKWEAGEYNSWLYPKVPLESYQIVLLPVCHQHHWFLLVASMETATISVLDSLPHAGRTQRLSNHWRHFMSARGDKRTWQTGEVNSNKQTDGNSCGVFVLMNAEAITAVTSPSIICQCHVSFFRKHETSTGPIGTTKHGM